MTRLNMIYCTFKALIYLSYFIVCSFSFGRHYLIKVRRESYDTISKSQLNSLGDPDLQPRWRFLRWWQQTSRTIDDYTFPEEPDCPHWTFPSPVVWAPWMETIWFGNIYDYRAAYFSDVMYSNNVPFKEGALLIKDPVRATTLALLYQRYPKYSIASHSISNMTLFNIFGSESVRLGRYKIPLNDQLILCTTDPLTKSEMKRYLNSFNALKWFTDKFFQQKRKRQRLLRVGDIFPESSSSQPVFQCDEEFLSSAIHFLEEDRIARVTQLKKLSLASTATTLENAPNSLLSVPSSQKITIISKKVVPHLWGKVNGKILSAKEFNNASCLRDANGKGFVVPLIQANSQYFIEILTHSILTHFAAMSIGHSDGNIKDQMKKSKIILGGDGRILNKVTMEHCLKVSMGFGYSNIHINEEGLLTTGLGKAILLDSVEDPADSFQLAIVLTGSGAMGGIKGYFGVRVLQKDVISGHVREWIKDDWDKVEHIMSTTNSIRTIPHRIKIPFSTQISTAPQNIERFNKRIADSTDMVTYTGTVPTRTFLDRYMNRISSFFDLPRIKSYIDDAGLIASIDCGPSQSCKIICEELMGVIGLEKSSLLKSSTISSGKSSTNSAHSIDPLLATETVSVFGESSKNWKDESTIPMMRDWWQSDQIVKHETDRLDDFNGPDIGFVLDYDASDCAVVNERISVAPQDARIIASSWAQEVSSRKDRDIKLNSFNIADEDDGLFVLLSWISMMKSGKSVSDIIDAHYEKHGVDILVTIDYVEPALSFQTQGIYTKENVSTSSPLTETPFQGINGIENLAKDADIIADSKDDNSLLNTTDSKYITDSIQSPFKNVMRHLNAKTNEYGSVLLEIKSEDAESLVLSLHDVPDCTVKFSFFNQTSSSTSSLSTSSSQLSPRTSDEVQSILRISISRRIRGSVDRANGLFHSGKINFQKAIQDVLHRVWTEVQMTNITGLHISNATSLTCQSIASK